MLSLFPLLGTFLILWKREQLFQFLSRVQLTFKIHEQRVDLVAATWGISLVVHLLGFLCPCAGEQRVTSLVLCPFKAR